MKIARYWIVLAMAQAMTVASVAQAADDTATKLLRFPDLHGDTVVFTYAGDLWKAPAAGGDAVRLTSHPGLELFARFSPDGQWIAFTGQYEGDEQVYVMPTSGGQPKQLTYYPARGPLPPRWGYDHQVYGWAPDGSAILFRSFRGHWATPNSRLYSVSPTGGLPVALPMPRAGAGDFSPDGSQLVYSPLARDFRSWKRYQGGWAQDLYLFDLEAGTSRQLTEHVRSDRDPMWVGDQVIFTSDRDGTLNLYSIPVGTQPQDAAAPTQLTQATRWDVRWPAADAANQRIVYEQGGELQILDLASGQNSSLAIRVPTDALELRPTRIPVEDYLEDIELSPKGERALLVARGDIFSVPIKNGPTRNLTRSSDAHDKAAAWSPDGSKIVFLSDRDGEEELYWMDQDGTGVPEQLTDGGQAMRYGPIFSPDGERIVFSDKEGRLFVLNLGPNGTGREVVEIANDPLGRINDYTWSPRGNHLAFSMRGENGQGSLYIWSAADQRLHPVTEETFNEFSPAWGRKGDYLYFLSDRSFAPQIDLNEWNYAVDRETEIFALALRTDVSHPFPPQSDEVTVESSNEDDAEQDEESSASDKPKKGKKKGKKDDQKKADQSDEDPLDIDFDGLAERVARVPVPADNHAALSANDTHLLYLTVPAFYYGRNGPTPPTLNLFDLDKRKSSELASGAFGGALSRDGNQLLLAVGGGLRLFKAQPGDSGKPVSTSGMMAEVVPHQEWEQIFDEVWRRFRDWFYVENLHGYDWEDLRERYRPLLAHVAHRSDLNYLLSEMIAELNVSHAYISGGDFDLPDRPDVALLGARLELDPEADRYRIAEIYQGQNEEERYRSPLTEIGVDVQVGDFVLGIDGVELTAQDNPYHRLRYKAGQPVELTVNSVPSFSGVRTATFSPITNEQPLLYYGWVDHNRQRVAAETDGKVGYLHIPDMGPNGLREFIKWFYGQTRKEGLVIDVRGNGGGNVSPMIIERLRRSLLGANFARTSDVASPYPVPVFHGHLVCLLNETSASDGDIFPHMFRTAGLGPLIGKRSWGGVVGISNRGTLIDGGSVSVPESGLASADGEWVIEGYGVDPDIEVENPPEALLAGGDPQLERGVEEILRAIQAEPRRLPLRPADPVRTQERYDGVPASPDQP